MQIIFCGQFMISKLTLSNHLTCRCQRVGKSFSPRAFSVVLSEVPSRENVEANVAERLSVEGISRLMQTKFGNTKNALNTFYFNYVRLQTHKVPFYPYQVFDDIAVEITMAILQFLNSQPSEEYLFRTLKALSKFVFVSFFCDVESLVNDVNHKMFM